MIIGNKKAILFATSYGADDWYKKVIESNGENLD